VIRLTIEAARRYFDEHPEAGRFLCGTSSERTEDIRIPTASRQKQDR